MIYLVIGLLIVLSYMFGGFSTARILAKSVRSLNIYKIGTGLADTENIFQNVSRPMGILVGLIDSAKGYLYLSLIYLVLTQLNRLPMGLDLGPIYNPGVMMLYAAGLLIGHCLPLSNKLRGGRGIFTYIGIMAYFNVLPTLITVFIAWLLVIIWKQIRFAQYMIVILPLFVTILLDSFVKIYSKVLPPYYIPMTIGMMALMGVLNFFVSKKLGEF